MLFEGWAGWCAARLVCWLLAWLRVWESGVSIRDGGGDAETRKDLGSFWRQSWQVLDHGGWGPVVEEVIVREGQGGRPCLGQDSCGLGEWETLQRLWGAEWKPG